MLQDLLAGQFHGGFHGIPAAGEMMRVGRIRPLASSGTQRMPSLPDVPTLVELGFAARTSANSLFEVGYSGVLSDDIRDHGANARFSVQF